MTLYPLSRVLLLLLLLLSRNDLLQAYYATKQLPKITPQANARFVTTVYLPSNSGILEPLIGPEKTSTGSAKRAAALEAIKKLYTIGKLDKHLQPSWKDPKHSAQLGASRASKKPRVVV